jgi:outer membrane protein TolC
MDNKIVRRVLLALLGGAAWLAPAAIAQTAAPSADTLPIAEAIRLALANNPLLHAADFGALAAQQRIGPAGALPDPQLQLGLMNRMAGDLRATSDPMTMNQVQLMQMVPFPGKLGRARDAVRHQAAAADADALEQRRVLVAQVEAAYATVAYTDRALDAMARTQASLRDFAEVATTMYAVGTGLQQDVLRAQVEVARMGESITNMRQDRIAGAARLNTLLGREAMAPVGALELPADTLPLPSLDSLIALALRNRAALQAGAERVAAADAALAGARRELLPDIQIGVAYQQRPAFPDMLSLMIGVSVPLFAASRQLPARREMSAMQQMAAAEQLDRRNETTALVIEARGRAERDRDLGRLYRNDILPQARAAAQSALAGYRVGKVNYMTLIDNQMTVTRYEIETYRLQADQQQAKADLVALTGGLP